MTDEKIADKYAEEYFGKKTELVELWKVKSYKDAFLAGLKAGKDMNVATKWYKFADGDLPKENKLYLVAIKDNGLAIAYFNGRHWETKFNLGDFGHLVETVIAWCEIPTFTDKE